MDQTERAPLESREITLADIPAAAGLFLRDPQWGEFYSERFRNEAEALIRRAPGSLRGIFTPAGRLLAVGAIDKAGFDYAYWSITWVMVDWEHRGLGLGRAVIDDLLRHAKEIQQRSHNPNLRVLLTTADDVAPFYEKGWGFQTIQRGPLPGEHLMSLDVVGPGLPLKK